MKAKLMAGVCAIVLSACASTIGVQVSPAPTDLGQGSQAADLRIHTDLLFGEQTFVLGKLAVVAASGRKDEFHSYAGVLAANADDLGTVLKLAFGETGGQQFADAWADGDNLFVGYLVAAVTQDQQAHDAAGAGLTSEYVPRLAGVIASNSGLPQRQATQLAAQQVADVEQVADDAGATSYGKLYADLATGYGHAIAFADVLAVQVVHQFADRLPGDPSSKAATFRSDVNALFQREAYFTTMVTDAVEGTNDERAAAAAQVAANAVSVGHRLADVLSRDSATAIGMVVDREANLLVTYATSGSATARQQVLDAAVPSGQTYQPDLTTAYKALLQAVDDQRNKSFDVLANDDRAGAVEFGVAADEVTDAAVRIAPGKLS